jgi:hypothetical protein
MFPEYISTILWPFAIKCYEDRLNNLIHHADGRTPYETLASLYAAPTNMSNFHTFGCPCYILYHRLQSGTGKIPKWEPQARMDIYVGCLPSYASNVGLILNPRTGHVSPQFHVVYDDDFTTVPYLHTATVPPHWAKLVCASLIIALYTESKVGIWHSLPELDVNPGDFASDNVNVDTVSSTTSTQYCEGDDGYSEGACDVVSHHKMTVTKQVTFINQGRDNEIQSNSPDSFTTQPDEWQMPVNIDLDSSGLQRSTQSTVLGRQDKVYSLSTIGLKKLKRSSTKACLVLFSSFCVVGVGLTCWVDSHQVLVQSSSRLTHAIGSFHRVNSLYNGTINCFSTLAQSSMA